MDLWNKCDICGRFISFKDFKSGRALRMMISPDSEFSSEDYETLCFAHKPKKLKFKDIDKALIQLSIK